MALSGAVACSGSDPAHDASIIARVGDHGVMREELAAYLTEALGGAEEAAAAEPEVKARLLDQMLDEELMLTEARRRKLEVPEAEAKSGPSGEGVDPGRVRRALLLKRFKEEVILRGLTVSPEEIRQQFESHRQEYHRPATVVLRKVLLDTSEEANNVRLQLVAAPAKFESIAENRSLAPDGGQAQPYDEEVLPDSLRAAVASLKEGELSPVIQDPQGFFIVKLEARQAERSPSLDEVSREIELKLLQDRSQQRYREALSALRKNISVQVYPEKLDFPYKRKEPTA